MRKFAFVWSILLFTIPLFCETPEEFIKGTAEEILTGYSKPLVTAFGTAMGTDFIDRKHHGFLGFDLDVKLSWVSIPEKAKTATYTIVVGDTVWIGTDTPITDTVFEGNTIFGGSEPLLNDPIRLKGLNLSGIPFAIPQANIGLSKGLNVSVRWVPFQLKGTSGQIFGAGLKYATNDYLPVPMFSLNFIAGVGYQYFQFGDITRTNNINGAVLAKLGISPPLSPLSFSPFVGVGMENTNMNFKYDYEGINIDKTIKGNNTFRGVVGVGIDFFLFDVDVSYNIGKMNAVGLGIGIGIR